MRDANYFVHRSTGTLVYDFGKGTKLWEPWWALVVTDQGIIDYFAWMMKKWGLPVQKGSAHGPHISFIRGEQPTDVSKWGHGAGEIDFWYANNVRTDNGTHAWIDCYSDRLLEIRAAMGYSPKPPKVLADGTVIGMSYHMTVGRI